MGEEVEMGSNLNSPLEHHSSMYHLANALTCFPFRAVKLDSANLLYKLENLKMIVTFKALHTKYKT